MLCQPIPAQGYFRLVMGYSGNPDSPVVRGWIIHFRADDHLFSLPDCRS
jgi:hypothetical protein